MPDALREIPTVANGDVSKDGLTLKYKLRPNIKWQDGAPLTCNDLKFTWQVVMNTHNNVVTTDGYKNIGSIDCSDPLSRGHSHEEALRSVPAAALERERERADPAGAHPRQIQRRQGLL